MVAVLATPLLGLLYGEEYREYADVVRLFSLYYVGLGFSTIAVAALTARRLTPQVFVGYAASAAVSVAASWALLAEMGPAGGVVGMIVGWAVSMTVFLRALGRPARFSLPVSGARGSGR